VGPVAYGIVVARDEGLGPFSALQPTATMRYQTNAAGRLPDLYASAILVAYRYLQALQAVT